VDRALTFGIVAALAVHSAVAFWAATLEYRPPRMEAIQEDKLVRTVQEQIELPKPKMPEPPKPEPTPPPEAKAESAKAEPIAKADTPKPASKPSRTPQPKSDQPPPPSNEPPPTEPPPLVLSQTYGSSGDSGVAVNTGKEDTLGDGSVAPTEANTRRRPQGEGPRQPPAGDPSGKEGGDPEGERRVEIVMAAPKRGCKVEWPDGAESGNRVVEVKLQLEIDLDGSVKKVRIMKGVGAPFDNAAVTAIKACAFHPGLRDGKPFVSKVPFIVEFKPNR
jgi:TonB family protein